MGARFVYGVVTPSRIHAYSSHAKRDAILRRFARRYKVPVNQLSWVEYAACSFDWAAIDFEVVSARIK
jgi:hypothetical protein